MVSELEDHLLKIIDPSLPTQQIKQSRVLVRPSADLSLHRLDIFSESQPEILDVVCFIADRSRSVIMRVRLRGTTLNAV